MERDVYITERAREPRVACAVAAVMNAIKRSNSFRRSVARRKAGPQPADTTGAVCKTGPVMRPSGKKWASKFAVLHRDVLCIFASSKDWTPFRSFPEEALVLHGTICRVGESDGRECLIVQALMGAEVLLGMDSAAEAAAWLEATQAAAAVRVAHGSAASPSAAAAAEAGLRRGEAAAAALAAEGTAGRLHQVREETRRLEAQAAAARNEVASAEAEAARLAEATARTLEELRHVRQVQMHALVESPAVGGVGGGAGFFATSIRPHLRTS